MVASSLLLATALATAPPLEPLEVAEARVLSRWDAQDAGAPEAAVAGKDRAALLWLRAALGPGLPANPFRKGSADHREAEAVRALLVAPGPRREALLRELRPLRAGSRAALWRWGSALARRGELSRELRRLWEDLLVEAGPGLLRGLALRHALCFALAEGDPARFAALRDLYSEAGDDVFAQVQPAFALLGAPAPRLRLWAMPDMKESEQSLAELGVARLRLGLVEGGTLPGLDTEEAWIALSPAHDLPADASRLEGPSLEEAEVLAARLRAAGRRAWLAPSRSALEALGLVWFPVRISLDTEGRIARLRMGDAALAP